MVEPDSAEPHLETPRSVSRSGGVPGVTRWRRLGRSERPAPGLSGDAARDLVEDVRARGYKFGYREGARGAVKRDVAVSKAEQAVTYGAVARRGGLNAPPCPVGGP